MPVRISSVFLINTTIMKDTPKKISDLAFKFFIGKPISFKT